MVQKTTRFLNKNSNLKMFSRILALNIIVECDKVCTVYKNLFKNLAGGTLH